MKHIHVSVGITFVLIILAGCSSPASTQPVTSPSTSRPPTIIPSTSTPPTAIPSTSTPPTAIDSLSFRDDFDGSLASGWQWLTEDSTHWNLTDVPGSLRIIVQPSNINDGRIRNFLVREAPTGNFEIATLVYFLPSKNFQIAGLLVYQEQGSAMQFGRGFSGCDSGCPGNAIYFDSYQKGVYDQTNFATPVSNDSVAYLRLTRIGTTYTGYYSEDGSTWTQIGTHESNITPTYVGLIGSQGYEGESPADFDYFTISLLP